MPAPAYEHLPSNEEEDIVRESFSRPRSASLTDHFIRPSTYYGEGPFDAPSSDEDDEEYLVKEGREDGDIDCEQEKGLRVGGGKRPAALRALILSLASLVFLSACIGVFAATTLYNGRPYRPKGALKVSLDHIFNAGDGVFSMMENGWIVLVDLKTNKTTPLVSTADITDENGDNIDWTTWKLSPDMKYILVKADHRKQWRHSSFGNYYVHDLETKETFPLLPPTDPPVTAYATWAPTGQSIAFVASNDLYVLPSPYPGTAPVRVTTTGNASLFHGVPDWIYEEEVFATDYALWWSPNSSKIAFLRLDETAVDEYRFPIYNPTDDAYAVIPYTEDVVIKYPKPGYNNPIVSVHVFDIASYLEYSGVLSATETTVVLDWSGRFPADNSIISQITWVDDSSLIVKEVNRAADSGNVVYFSLNRLFGGTTSGAVVRRLGKDGEEADEGWIESDQNIYPVPPSLRSGDSPAYLDIVPSADGFNHIALFDPADSATPRFLTSGPWEVTGGIQAVDAQRGLIYFQAAQSSIERHLYSIPISSPDAASTVTPTPLIDESMLSSYSADFSPGAGFYLLNYRGPGIPWQKIIQVDNPDFSYVLTENAGLNATLAAFETATVTYSTITSDGYELNVKEMRPPRMDTSGRTKYPVLFRVYGGPGSQLVDVNYHRDWHDYLVCTLQYIVVVVDGRGTGFQGRKLRNPVRNNLGFWETQDQINAARIWAGKPYVDPKRIGIWGWSYGGFMASKVAEADAGIHSLAIAVAPVTSWRLYDSIYTERYMGLPDDNLDGYINASISSVEGFRNVDYLLMHGSGDDNVHFANSAHLLDMLTKARVRNFRFRMFTDRSGTMTVQPGGGCRLGCSEGVYCSDRCCLCSEPGEDGDEEQRFEPPLISANALRLVLDGHDDCRAMHETESPFQPSAEGDHDDLSLAPVLSCISFFLPALTSPDTVAQREGTPSVLVTDGQPTTELELSPYLQYMSNTSLAQSRPTKILHAGFSYEDWLALKTLFAKVVKLVNDVENEGRQVVALIRAVIHQCHRALVSHLDMIVGVPEDNENQPSKVLKSPDQQLLRHLEQQKTNPTTPQQAWAAACESNSRTTEYLCALHAILGTALFLFGKIIDKNPFLALEGEPTAALPYWLFALDVFESGYNLPTRTNASYSHREHWLLAVSDSRVLIALIGQFITEEENKRSTTELFTADSKWARNSPLGTIGAMRPPPTQRMALSLMSLNELMVIATDQFMRGILYMPHHDSTEFSSFSRAGELLTISTEVLDVLERLPSSTERQHWVLWVQSVLNLVKPEMSTEGQHERCNMARARCHLLLRAEPGPEEEDKPASSNISGHSVAVGGVAQVDPKMTM
ncbi:hypothetical protein ID866_4190 [Astraeus odoratus]|nr:hypothetical protein ID866_4190 [Astraeus odoratus]